MADSVDTSSVAATLLFVQTTIEEAGRLALAARNGLGEAYIKANETPVTQLDHAIEALLVERIRRKYPHHQIIAEEGSIGGSDPEFTWVIDPLDGTRAYASGLPIWGISLGILHNGEPLAGGFYMPAVDELYWGDENGAFLNGQPLSPPVTSLDDPLAFLAVPSNSHLLYDISFHRLRSLGSTAAHLIYVAKGAAVGALTRQVSIWDLAGALPILQRQGIELRYLGGASFSVGDILNGQSARQPLLAAPSHLMDQMMAAIHLKPNPDSVG